MEPEDLEPRKKAPAPRELDSLSIEELRAYIAQLEAEIERVKAKIGAKQAHLSGAAGLFRADPRAAGWRPAWALGLGLAVTAGFAPLLWPAFASLLLVAAVLSRSLRRIGAALVVASVSRSFFRRLTSTRPPLVRFAFGSSVAAVGTGALPMPTT